MVRPRCRTTLSAWLFGTLAVAGCGPAADAQPAATHARPAPAHAKAKGAAGLAPGEKWVRLVRDKNRQPLAMQTAIVRYVPAGDVVAGKKPEAYDEYVDLVGAVHIADNDPPDLLVLDMMLPKRSGFLVLERVKTLDPPPVVIMVTANEGKRHQAYAESLGVDCYLQKPVPLGKLLETAVDLVRQREDEYEDDDEES